MRAEASSPSITSTHWGRDIEITGGGKPTVRVSGTAARLAEMLGITGFEITITHTDMDALVFAIALGEHED